MNMKKIKFLLLVFFFVLLPLRPQGYSETDIISVEKSENNIKRLQKMKLDLLLEWSNRLYFVCNLTDLYRLQDEGISYIIETANFYPYNRGDILAQGGINGAFHSYLELEADLMALEAAYPHLARVVDIGDTLESRNIYALKISDNVSLDENEAEVFFVGCHHAREWISVEIPYLLGKYLVENYESNRVIKSLVNRSEIWIVPLLNPDGLEYSIHTYRYWRKNRRDNGNGSFGVDLNRNYGYKWGYDNQGSSSNSFDEVYRGPSAFSEPETQVVRDFFQQRKIQALITYHSYSQVIMYPWGYTRSPTSKDELLKEVAAEMSERIKAVNGNIYRYGRAGGTLYLTNGDTTDWSFGAYRIPSYTIELPPIDIFHGGFFNAEHEISAIFEENLPAALYLIKWSIQYFKR
jgi:carboxypeptidase T